MWCYHGKHHICHVRSTTFNQVCVAIWYPNCILGIGHWDVIRHGSTSFKKWTNQSLINMTQQWRNMACYDSWDYGISYLVVRYVIMHYHIYHILSGPKITWLPVNMLTPNNHKWALSIYINCKPVCYFLIARLKNILLLWLMTNMLECPVPYIIRDCDDFVSFYLLDGCRI